MRCGGKKGGRKGRCGGDFAELVLVPDDDRRNDRRQRHVSSGTLLQEHTTTSRFLVVVTETSQSRHQILDSRVRKISSRSTPEYLTSLLFSKISNITSVHLFSL